MCGVEKGLHVRGLHMGERGEKELTYGGEKELCVEDRRGFAWVREKKGLHMGERKGLCVGERRSCT